MKWLWPLFSGKIEVRWKSKGCTKRKMQDGLVLVFDLDQALIDSRGLIREKNNGWKDIESYIQKSLNMRIVEEVLRPAVALRRISQELELSQKPRVAAIILLTNNIVEFYIDCVEYYIARHLGILSESVFDYVMKRDNSMRGFPSFNPPKRLEDVENILKKINKPTVNLAERTFMFDDCDRHKIKYDLANAGYPDHYIQIIGPEDMCLPYYGIVNEGFIAGKPDLTDYTAVLKAMIAASGTIEAGETIPSICSMNEIMAF
jgi:hypothetical protein